MSAAACCCLCWCLLLPAAACGCLPVAPCCCLLLVLLLVAAAAAAVVLLQSNSLQSKKQTARHPFRNTSETAKHHLISCPKRSKGTPKKGLTSLLKPYYKIATLPLPAAACCCLLLPAAASAGVCCCLLLPAAACCCLLLPAAACCLLLPAAPCLFLNLFHFFSIFSTFSISHQLTCCCCCCCPKHLLLLTEEYQKHLPAPKQQGTEGRTGPASRTSRRTLIRRQPCIPTWPTHKSSGKLEHKNSAAYLRRKYMLSLLLLLLPLLLLLVRLNLLVFACLIPWRAPPCVCRGRRILW